MVEPKPKISKTKISGPKNKEGHLVIHNIKCMQLAMNAVAKTSFNLIQALHYVMHEQTENAVTK